MTEENPLLDELRVGSPEWQAEVRRQTIEAALADTVTPAAPTPAAPPWKVTTAADITDPDHVLAIRSFTDQGASESEAMTALIGRDFSKLAASQREVEAARATAEAFREWEMTPEGRSAAAAHLRAVQAAEAQRKADDRLLIAAQSDMPVDELSDDEIADLTQTRIAALAEEKLVNDVGLNAAYLEAVEAARAAKDEALGNRDPRYFQKEGSA